MQSCRLAFLSRLQLSAIFSPPSVVPLQQGALPSTSLHTSTSAASPPSPTCDIDQRSSLHFPRRAVMYVPASDERKVQKIATMTVDTVVFDIEDGVAISQKFDLFLSYHRGPSPLPLPLYIIVESPAGLQNLPTICHYASQQARHLRLCAVVFGSDDFLARLGGVRTTDASEVTYARQLVVTQARAWGVEPIDMVDTNFKDLETLKVQSEAEAAARMGYTGKQVIHPTQVGVVQEAFSPSQQMVDWARGLIEAFHHHQETGKGAFVYCGQMIDEPLLQAQNIVRLQDIITNR